MTQMFDKARAAIVDPDTAFAQALSDVLEPCFSVRVHATYGQFLRDGYRPLTDVIIGEVGDDDQEGLAHLESLPRIGAPVVTFITASADAHAAVTAMRGGVFDYLFKPVSRADLEVLTRRLVDEIERRRAARSDECASIIEQLSPRERQVLELVGRGLSTKEIAHLLILSPRTVDAHRAQLIAKTGVRRSTELILLANFATARSIAKAELATSVRRQAG